MRSGNRTADYHLIRENPTHALYYAASIPSTAWGPLLSQDPSFKLIVTDEGNISPKEQGQWFKRLKEAEFFDLPYLFVVSSDLDDDLATNIGYDLMKRALAKRLRVQITESSSISEEEVSGETLYMLTNLTDDAPQERIQAVRDWCYRHKTYCRILCTAGDPAVLVRRLKLAVNAVFYLDSRVAVEKDFS